MDLTGKRRAFADARLAGKSNKDAAIAAGYSAKTAGPAGSRLAKDPAIAAFIAKYKQPGAEAPPAPPPPPAAPSFDVQAAIMHSDPKNFLLVAMNDPAAPAKLRVEAAKALMPFMHKKPGETGKKEQREADAKKVAGRFAPAAPPQLKAVK